MNDNISIASTNSDENVIVEKSEFELIQKIKAEEDHKITDNGIDVDGVDIDIDLGSTDEIGEYQEEEKKEKLPFKEMFKQKMSQSFTKEEKKSLMWMLGMNVAFFITYLVFLIVGIAGDFDQENPILPQKWNEVVIGLLFMILCFIFSTMKSGIWIVEKFYVFVPGLFLCYFLPGLLGSFDVFVRDNELGGVASHYFLPAILCLLCLSVDIKGIMSLGFRAIIAFLVGTAGIVFGGPLSVALMGAMWPETMAPYPNPAWNATSPDEVPEFCEPWRGLTYLAGSWIGGGANAVAMRDIFEPCPDDLSQAIAVDIFCANIWVAILFFCIGKRDTCNKLLRANPKPVNDLKDKMEDYQEKQARIPTGLDFIYIACLAMIACGLSNGIAIGLAEGFGQIDSSFISYIAFDSVTLWRVMIATVLGFVFSFTPLKDLEGAGASKAASVMLYFLVLTIGMGMDVTAIVDNPGLFILGFIWIITHVVLLVTVCLIMKAPLFFLAVGSQANIGGAASAPVVAAQFSNCLAPVGALFAIFGYVIGTFAAWASSLMMQAAAPDLPPSSLINATGF